MADLPLSDRFGNVLVSFDSATGTDLETLDDPAPVPLSLIVVVCAGRALMVLDAARGQWELPGGMREEDETARQAAVREPLPWVPWLVVAWFRCVSVRRAWPRGLAGWRHASIPPRGRG